MADPQSFLSKVGRDFSDALGGTPSAEGNVAPSPADHVCPHCGKNPYEAAGEAISEQAATPRGQAVAGSLKKAFGD